MDQTGRRIPNEHFAFRANLTKSVTTTTMPKELRKRGRRHKSTRTEDQKPAQGREVPDEGPSTAGPSWIVPRTDGKQQLNPEAPFGYVDPELKAYFRTVDDQLKEWQQNRDHTEGEDDVDPNESASCCLPAPACASGGIFFLVLNIFGVLR
jgi:hypothetical protein